MHADSSVKKDARSTKEFTTENLFGNKKSRHGYHQVLVQLKPLLETVVA